MKDISTQKMEVLHGFIWFYDVLWGNHGNIWGYPLVNVHITNGKITMLSMGKSTIYNLPFSIATLNYQSVNMKVSENGGIPQVIQIRPF